MKGYLFIFVLVVRFPNGRQAYTLIAFDGFVVTTVCFRQRRLGLAFGDLFGFDSWKKLEIHGS